MTRWEYLSASLSLDQGFFSGPDVNHASLEQVLNQHGEEGWELVNAFDTNQHHGTSRAVILIFKRPVR